MQKIATSKIRLLFDKHERPNLVRAAVMGANDGIISTAGIVMGVAGANLPPLTLLLTGLSAMIAGACSMGGGEYVSVSAQRDAQKAFDKLSAQTVLDEDNGFDSSLQKNYQQHGLSVEHAQNVAQKTNADLLTVLIAKRHYQTQQRLNPWHAAMADFMSFILGALLPLICIVFLPANIKVVGTMLSVVVCLFFTGYYSSRLGQSPSFKGAWCNMLVGILTMVISYLLGTIVG